MHRSQPPRDQIKRMNYNKKKLEPEDNFIIHWCKTYHSKGYGTWGLISCGMLPVINFRLWSLYRDLSSEPTYPNNSLGLELIRNKCGRKRFSLLDSHVTSWRDSSSFVLMTDFDSCLKNGGKIRFPRFLAKIGKKSEKWKMSINTAHTTNGGVLLHAGERFGRLIFTFSQSTS